MMHSNPVMNMNPKSHGKHSGSQYLQLEAKKNIGNIFLRTKSDVLFKCPPVVCQMFTAPWSPLSSG